MSRFFKEFSYIFLVGFVYIGAIFTLNLTRGGFGFGSVLVSFVGVILAFLGIFFWALGFFTLRECFSILPEPRTYKKTGIYRFISHPIYTGIIFTFIGLSLASGSFWGLFYALFVLCPFNILRAKLEEREIRRKFPF